MSNTIVDMPKVTQMLDAGWRLRLFKNEMGSYTVVGVHRSTAMVKRVQEKIISSADDGVREIIRSTFDGDNTIDTDDFTPEQALTRLAYKVFGEII